jgi:hypothetical protein
VLEGNLDDFTLPDILRLLAFTSKSGRLALQREGAAGRIDLVEGRVREASGDAEHLVIARRLLGGGIVASDDLAAALDGRSSLPTDLELASDLAGAGAAEPGTIAEVLREQTVDAVFDLLRWSEGSFRFEGGQPDPRGEEVLDLAVPVDEVLAEATSRLESWPSVAERTGDADAVVTISRPPDERAEVSVTPDGWSLLALVDGRRTVADLAHLSGQGEFRTRRTLVSLLDEGVVTVGETGGPGHIDRLLADHDRLAALEAGLGAPAAPRATREAAPEATTLAAPSAPTSSPQPAARDAADAAPARSAAERPAARSDASATPRPAVNGAARPCPVTVRTDEVATATAAEATAAEATPAEATPAEATVAAGTGDGPPADAPLRAKARAGRLRTDPSVDAELVRRLIDGVESL